MDIIGKSYMFITSEGQATRFRQKKCTLESLLGYFPSLFLYPTLSVQLNITCSGLKKVRFEKNCGESK